MSVTLNSPTYPIDYTGALASNKITGEQQALTGGARQPFYFIVPNFAPFFETSLKVFYRAVDGTVRQLMTGIDFYPTHYFISASRACSKEIYGSISFFDLTLNGAITMEYQTIGGNWTQNSNAIAAILADRLNNPRTTAWEQVVDMPVMFPVVDHEWNLKDMVGMTELIVALNALNDTIIAAANGMTLSHINNVNNPHLVTPAQIGAVTIDQLHAAITLALQQAGSNSTDGLTEGVTNLFFTSMRSLSTLLTGLDMPNAINRPITQTDSIKTAFETLQAQLVSVNNALNVKVDMKTPTTTGPSITTMNTVDGTTANTAIVLAAAGAHRVLVKASTSLAFDITGLPDTVGKVIEFALTLQNDSTAGRGVAFPTNIKWAGGVIPPRSTGANAVDEYYFFSSDNKVTWTGSLSNQDTR